MIVDLTWKSPGRQSQDFGSIERLELQSLNMKKVESIHLAWLDLGDTGYIGLDRNELRCVGSC